jgi:hypothetical protein
VRWRDSIRKGNHNITFVTLVYLGTPVSRWVNLKQRKCFTHGTVDIWVAIFPIVHMKITLCWLTGILMWIISFKPILSEFSLWTLHKHSEGMWDIPGFIFQELDSAYLSQLTSVLEGSKWITCSGVRGHSLVAPGWGPSCSSKGRTRRSLWCFLPCMWPPVAQSSGNERARCRPFGSLSFWSCDSCCYRSAFWTVFCFGWHRVVGVRLEMVHMKKICEGQGQRDSWQFSGEGIINFHFRSPQFLWWLLWYWRSLIFHTEMGTPGPDSSQSFILGDPCLSTRSELLWGSISPFRLSWKLGMCWTFSTGVSLWPWMQQDPCLGWLTSLHFVTLDPIVAYCCHRTPLSPCVE